MMTFPRTTLPIEAIRASSRNPKVVRAVSRFYQRADAELSEGGSDCEQCGQCCDFAQHDHRLFVASIELGYLLAVVGPTFPDVPTWPARCPYQVAQRCSIHPHRPLGCRAFVCKPRRLERSDRSIENVRRVQKRERAPSLPLAATTPTPSSEAPAPVFEPCQNLHRGLVLLHRRWNVPYRYVEWGQGLRQLAAATSPLHKGDSSQPTVPTG